MKRLKRILIASYDLQVGGVERSLISLLEHFDYDNYDVNLLLFNHQGDFFPYLTSKARLYKEDAKLSSMRKSIIQVFKEGHVFLGMSRLAAKVKSVTECKGEESHVQMQDMWRYALPFLPKHTESYDVAISYLWPHDYVAYKVKAKKKIAWIHTDYTKIKTDVKRDLKVWNEFDHIISISEDVTKSFITKYPSLASKIVLIENIVSPEFIRKQAEEEIAEFDPNYFNLVSVGRLCYAKGYDNAIKALRQLHDQGLNNIKWYIVGYGGDEQMLKDLIKENQLEDSFILLGKKINPYPYIKACDLYVQSSRYEGKAVTVSEAKVLGKPILLTNYDTAHSQLDHGVDGYITELSIDGIVEGIRNLYLDNNLRDQLQLTAKQRDYGNSVELNKLYSLFEKVNK